MVAFLEDGLVIVHSQILALLAFEKLVDVGDDGTDFADDENVSAEIKYLLCHVSIDAVDKRNHSDDSRYANHHSKQGEDRPQFIRPQRLQSDADGFSDVHDSGFGIWLRA